MAPIKLTHTKRRLIVKINWFHWAPSASSDTSFSNSCYQSLSDKVMRWALTKAITYDKRPKMKRDTRQKSSPFPGLPGIFLHFRPFVYVRALAMKHDLSFGLLWVISWISCTLYNYFELWTFKLRTFEFGVAYDRAIFKFLVWRAVAH